MSRHDAHEPKCQPQHHETVKMIIRSAEKDLGGFTVRRALPNRLLRALGPFVFVDHMGPSTFPPGGGISVRPHPHIGLATVTYLYEGEVFHRDSLGSEKVIAPGAINWMTAGRGIAHSERMTEQGMSEGGSLHGLQLWVALPKEDEEIDPSFRHYAKDELPEVESPGVHAKVLVGELLGAASPVETRNPITFVDIRADAGATVPLPDIPERGIYIVEGALRCGEETVEGPCLVVLQPGAIAPVVATTASKLAILGGDALDGERTIWWNFVSSRPERIEQAKRDWAEDRFGTVIHDDEERIPLPTS